jgi:hypothetical protein
MRVIGRRPPVGGLDDHLAIGSVSEQLASIITSFSLASFRATDGDRSDDLTSFSLARAVMPPLPEPKVTQQVGCCRPGRCCAGARHPQTSRG